MPTDDKEPTPATTTVPARTPMVATITEETGDYELHYHKLHPSQIEAIAQRVIELLDDWADSDTQAHDAGPATIQSHEAGE